MTEVVSEVTDNDPIRKAITQVQQESSDAPRQQLLILKNCERKPIELMSNKGSDAQVPWKKKESKKAWSFLSVLLSCACGGKEFASLKEERNSIALPNISTQSEHPESSIYPVFNKEAEASFTPNFEQVNEQSTLVNTKCLLGPINKEYVNRKCLVLDLDETLVHTSFKVVEQADFIIPVEIEGQYHDAYILKRPGVDEFLKEMGKTFEIVVFTASLSKYADPVLDTLDIHQVIQYRLFRESCYNYSGNYVKDLSHLGRDLSQVIILDNSPASYIFHPTNAVPVSSWFNDPHDTELLDLIPLLEDLADVEDVTLILDTLIDASGASIVTP